jgi:hypothetical protein
MYDFKMEEIYMNYKELFKEANEEVKERYELVISGISSNIENNTCEKSVIVDCFTKTAKLVDSINNIYRLVVGGELKDKLVGMTDKAAIVEKLNTL